jgi:glycosyltransferase involved in cell wall biosynthesis
MTEPTSTLGPLSAGEPLDLVLLGPLPYRDREGADLFQLGGVLYSVALLQGLARLGHRVRALATGPSLPSELEPGDLGPGVEVEWFSVEFLPSHTPSPADIRARQHQLEDALDRITAESRPDLVLLGHEAQVHYGVEVCKARGLRTVLFAHGVPTHTLLDDSYPRHALEVFREQLSQIDLVVTVSRYLEEILRTLDLTRVRTIRTGIDTDLFSPRPKDSRLLELHGIDADRFVVGSFSRMRPTKRLADLVASAELVLRSEPGVVYLLAGDCPERQAVIDLVDAKGLSESVRFVGEVHHTEVPDYMALCDAVVLASEREGFGLNVLEAQACGRAVIATDIPALRELVEHGRTGLLYPVGDVEALAASTLELVRDPALRRALGEQGRTASLPSSVGTWIRACEEALAATAAAVAAE